MEERGLTYVHPFDDLQLIAGQGTLGLEIYQDFPAVQIAVVPIGGGGLISGVAMALKACNPEIRIIGVESSGAPAMQRSVAAGERVTLETVDCAIDGGDVVAKGRERNRRGGDGHVGLTQGRDHLAPARSVGPRSVHEYRR